MSVLRDTERMHAHRVFNIHVIVFLFSAIYIFFFNGQQFTIFFSYNLEIRIRFRSPVKRVKRLYNYLSLYGELLLLYHCKGKYKMNNYYFNETYLIWIDWCSSSIIAFRKVNVDGTG